ncbi:MAG: class I SAM-dependent methyltransferase [Pseudomonadota bacterium]
MSCQWYGPCFGQYLSSYYCDNRPSSTSTSGIRNENLEALTFDTAVFDLVITQDVFEHIEHPVRAFSEVGRVLKPGGSHVFTIPFYPEQLTETRVRIEHGQPVSEHELEYHGNPVDDNGSLVFTRFGFDLKDIIFNASGMTTTIHPMHEPRLGIEGESVIVFHSVKSSDN